VLITYLPRKELDGFFHYFPHIDLTLDQESRLWFGGLLDSFNEPGLIVWDSLLGHLSLCGINEDSSGDFEQWARFFLDSPRARGWTFCVLDHSGHAGTHERGTSRKRQNVQVSFKVEKKEAFDRTTSGRLKLTREKDRIAYLPATVEVTLGGFPFGFKTRYDGQRFLKYSENRTLFFLYKCGPSGATHKEWRESCTTGEKAMSDSTFNRALKELVKDGYVELGGKHYFVTKKGEDKVSLPTRLVSSRHWYGC
jgi:hypothetical protein